MTLRKAIRRTLDSHGFESVTFKTRTVSFQDLARADRVFVYLNGRTNPETFQALQGVAREHGAIMSDS
jgi:hypothetical protein